MQHRSSKLPLSSYGSPCKGGSTQRLRFNFLLPHLLATYSLPSVLACLVAFLLDCKLTYLFAGLLTSIRAPDRRRDSIPLRNRIRPGFCDASLQKRFPQSPRSCTRLTLQNRGRLFHGIMHDLRVCVRRSTSPLLGRAGRVATVTK